MKPKIAYLIDECYGWADDPDWKFYPEDAVPQSKIQHAHKNSIKRIVYWVVEDSE